MERLLQFADCSDKTELHIAQMITETLEGLADCRAQGYDNGACQANKMGHK